jgi:hypothetical protein
MFLQAGANANSAHWCGAAIWGLLWAMGSGSGPHQPAVLGDDPAGGRRVQRPGVVRNRGLGHLCSQLRDREVGHVGSCAGSLQSTCGTPGTILTDC